jgi:hypothetical protein
MKDLIGNELAVGDKVQVHLPAANIIGFIAEVKQTALVARLRGSHAVDHQPGHVLVQCLVAIPVEPESDAVAQLVKVYDVAKAASQTSQAGVTTQMPN